MTVDTDRHEEAPARSRQPQPPSASKVVFLQSVRANPAVSVLLNTRPGDRMSPDDARRLLSLVEQVRARLTPSVYGEHSAVLAQQLRAAADLCVGQPTLMATALFVSDEVREVLALPVPVVERAVVDPTFATRDLVRALHRTPRHVVLVLNRGEARLFDGVGAELRPARGGAFPMRTEGRGVVEFLRRVDRGLGAYRALHPSPLVVVGPADTLASFAAMSKHCERLAGTVAANVPTAPLPELAARIRPVIEDYLRSREGEALALLERRTGAKRAVGGMRGAWLAARQERPEMLAVEEGLYYPARISADGDWLTAAEDVDHPDVIDDAVDELIETVLDRGGWVALVPDGALAAQEGVALTLRAAH